MMPRCAFPNCRYTATKNSPLCGACERNALRHLEQEMMNVEPPMEPWASVRATLQARKQAHQRRSLLVWLTVGIIFSAPAWVCIASVIVSWGGR